jgi:redox-sensitive bicupin YhaK (pirin superfamily)
MIELRKAADRGHADHGWLSTWHSFSFADYYDPQQMGWGPLRVINEDFVAPAKGFPTHGHRDMEIVTYPLAGPLQHKDSMGSGTIIQRPEVQRMSAGRGVMHSEFNASAAETVHLLQIWIEPDVLGIAPEYEQKAFPDDAKRGRWLPLATPDGREGSLSIHQDAVLLARLFAPGETGEWTIVPGRRAYLHLVGGAATVNGLELASGDGAKIAEENSITVAATAEAEILLFDLP